MVSFAKSTSSFDKPVKNNKVVLLRQDMSDVVIMLPIEYGRIMSLLQLLNCKRANKIILQLSVLRGQTLDGWIDTEIYRQIRQINSYIKQ
jgi:hypothetical protein